MRRAFVGSGSFALVALAFLALSAADGAAQGVSAVDSLGRKVSLDAPAARIVSLSPAATEALFAVGAGPKLVGDTTYCDYPEEARSLPKVGGFVAETVSVERVLALKPDLVVSGGSLHAGLEASLRRLGLRVFAYEPGDFRGVADAMMALGALSGTPGAALKAAAALTGAIKRITDATSAIPIAQRPRVLWLVYDDPLMTCGSVSLPHAILEAAGGRDIFADLKGPWPQVSSEEVIRRAPEVILSPDDMGDKVSAARIGQRPGWSTVPAVRSGRILLLPAALVSRAGPRVAAGVMAAAKALHPELFP
ncbi:MAG TPA: helical backbone metal receptor [Rectinemataceae bacterium]|nr:helical backbone metal receptor [Rectinemataceae bacterium]